MIHTPPPERPIWLRFLSGADVDDLGIGHVGTLGEHGLSGIKVVGDFVPNCQHGLPSELALLRYR